jgi:hypothetical protein
MAHNAEAVAVEEPRVIPLREEQPISLPSNRLRNLLRRPRRISRRALLALAAVAVVAGLGWWIYAQQFETTDDAQIDGHLDAISARISGTVIYINPKVENNQYVEAGTLLLELDPNDYQAELDHAKGELATREGDAHSASVNVLRLGFELTLQLPDRVEGVPNLPRFLLGFFPASSLCTDQSVFSVAIDVEPLDAIASCPIGAVSLWALATVPRVDLHRG